MVAALLRVGISALAILALLAIVASLIDARRFRRKVRESLRWTQTAYAPRVLLIVPCRGADPHLERNLTMILGQTGIAYRTVFVVDEPDDPAVAAVREAMAAAPQARAAIAIATLRGGYSGKSSALLRGLEERVAADEVVAFADSDVRPDERWLRTLVQPLADPRVGVATSYRWYVPSDNAMPSVVRAAWNAVGLNILFNERYNFAWGGSTAIRSETLDGIDLASRWRGTLSEDLALTDAIKRSGRAVAFVPAAIASTIEDSSWRELFAWSTRQTAMVAVWGRRIGRYATVTYAVYSGIVGLGGASLALGVLLDPFFFLPAAAFLLNLPATIAKNHHRAASVFLANPGLRSEWRVPAWKFALASLLVPWVIAYNLVRAHRIEELEWRGRRYRLYGGTLAGGPPQP